MCRLGAMNTLGSGTATRSRSRMQTPSSHVFLYPRLLNTILKVGILAIVGALGMSLGSCSAPVAAIGMVGAGVGTGRLLNDFDDRVTHVLQNAAAAGSLLSSKAARDAQLL